MLGYTRTNNEELKLTFEIEKWGLREISPERAKFINSMSELTIRFAEEIDVLQIAEIIYRWSSWQCERDKTIKEAIQDNNQDILVAELDGKLVGVMQQMFFPDIMLGGCNCHVNSLLVDKKYRGKKIGSQFVDKAIENAKKSGAVEMHVDTIYKRVAEFYRKRGFKDDGAMLELGLQKDHDF